MGEPVSEQQADQYDIRDNPEANRWEVFDANDEMVAFAEYRLRPGAVAFTHTVVDPAYEGKGIGTRLARTVLDDAVSKGLRIVPYCPFISAYLQRHFEYNKHVDMPHQH